MFCDTQEDEGIKNQAGGFGMISQRLRVAVKLSDLRAYKIAHKANLHPSTLSRIVNGIEKVTPGDPRVLRIAKTLGLSPAECFEEVGGMSHQIPNQEGVRAHSHL